MASVCPPTGNYGMHWKDLYFRQSFYLLPFVAPPIFSTNFRRPYCEPYSRRPYFRRPYSLLPFFPQLNHRQGQIARYLCQLFTLLTKLNVPKRVCPAQFQNRRNDNCFRCQCTALVNQNDGIPSHSPVCAVNALREYLLQRNPTNLHEPLFTLKNGEPLTRTVVNSNLRELLNQLGYLDKEHAPHSFWIGAATTAAAANLPPWLIKTLGRWRSDCYELYIKTPRSIIDSVPKKLASVLSP